MLRTGAEMTDNYESGLSFNTLTAIAADLQGTCQFLSVVLERREIKADPDTVARDLSGLPSSIECCKGCGWWHEVCELERLDDDDEYDRDTTGYCDQCADEYRKDD